MKSKNVLVVAITGTPGTGKTFFAKKVSKAIAGAKIIEINGVVTRHHTFSKTDRFGTKIVNLGKLNSSIRGELSRFDAPVVVVVGHLAPELSMKYDIAVVMRCSLSKLASRLEERKYHKEKIAENLVAEAFDYCGLKVEAAALETYEIEDAIGQGMLIRYLLARSGGKTPAKPTAKKIDKFKELTEIIGDDNKYGL